MRVAVLGGSGFIGSRLVNRLRSLELDVVAPTRAELDLAVEHRFRQLDGCTHIVMLADSLAGRAIGGSSDELDLLDRALDISVRGLDRLCCQLLRSNIRLIFTSSCVYAPWARRPSCETDPVGALGPYGCIKIISENVIESAVRQGLDAIIVRPFNAYGPRQTTRFVIPKIVNAALRGMPLRLDNLESRRDFVHVDDVVEGIYAALDKGKRGATYNLGTGRSTSVGEVLTVVEDVIGRRIDCQIRSQMDAQPISESCADVGRARLDLRWIAEIDLRTGLDALIRGTMVNPEMNHQA